MWVSACFCQCGHMWLTWWVVLPIDQTVLQVRKGRSLPVIILKTLLLHSWPDVAYPLFPLIYNHCFFSRRFCQSILPRCLMNSKKILREQPGFNLFQVFLPLQVTNSPQVYETHIYYNFHSNLPRIPSEVGVGMTPPTPIPIKGMNYAITVFQHAIILTSPR